tara:strand:+ start:3784 stop:4770 length:987 start_codon:yes stop_codon:yes gene_type:complete
MITGIISFCDRVAHNIKSNEIKTKILEELEEKYSIKIIQKHYYRLTDESVKHIVATPHLVTIRSQGNPYLLYFTRYEDKEIIYLLDKKIHPGYVLPRIIIGRGLYNKDIFNGTVIDGEMVKVGKNWIFLMNDIISYKGEHLRTKNLPERLSIMYEMLEKEYTEDETMDMYSYMIKKYANLCVDSLDKIIKENYIYNIRGIYFWAYNLKYKPKLVNIDDTLIKDVIIKSKEIPEFVMNKPEITKEEITKTEIIKPDTIKILTFSKTDTPDIYNVIDDKNEKLGYACIQSQKTSKMVRDEFKETSANMTVKFKCELNKKWNKWEPLEVMK